MIQLHRRKTSQSVIPAWVTTKRACEGTKDQRKRNDIDSKSYMSVLICWVMRHIQSSSSKSTALKKGSLIMRNAFKLQRSIEKLVK